MDCMRGPLQSKPGVINYHKVTPLGSTPFLFIHILAGTRWISEHQSTISATAVTRSDARVNVCLWRRWQERRNILTQCPLSLTPRAAIVELSGRGRSSCHVAVDHDVPVVRLSWSCRCWILELSGVVTRLSLDCRRRAAMNLSWPCRKPVVELSERFGCVIVHF